MQISSHCLESKGCSNVNTCQVSDNGHSPLERCLKDISQKISQVNEIQEQLVDDEDGSLKDIQASLANLEANLTSCRHDLKQQVRNKSNALHQCITDSLTGLQSSQLSLDEQLTILENKANGIQTAQDKHTILFSQALAGIHSLSQGFMTLLDHTQDIDIIQLSLKEELHHITHGLPTSSRVVDDSKETSPEGPLQHTSGAGSAAPSSEAGKNLAAQLYHYSMAIICSVIPVFSRQPGILLTTYKWQILHIAGLKLSRTQLHALIPASTMIFPVFIGFFSALRGGPLKTQEEVDWPLWYALHYGGLPSIYGMDILGGVDSTVYSHHPSCNTSAYLGNGCGCANVVGATFVALGPGFPLMVFFLHLLLQWMQSTAYNM
ncbi:hypothetical protein EDC04DRAFT_2600296 [Pisolithus marmoratus]|nr:hypothetical protein EDC04DRAFT_2600296 [Pisolithus marmoratus]